VRTRPSQRRSAHGAGGVDVKSLLREAGVPSWLREGLPFLHDPRVQEDTAGALLAIADLWLADAVRASPATRHRGRIVWQER
jgi:tRNA(Ile)-lysidine synthetase-like protein